MMLFLLWAISSVRACEDQFTAVIDAFVRANPAFARDRFAWHGDDDHAVGDPGEAEAFRVEITRTGDGRGFDFAVVFAHRNFTELMRFTEAFGRVQKYRFFETRWVGEDEGFGKMRGTFRADPEPGHAGVEDGIRVVADLLRARGSVRLGRH